MTAKTSHTDLFRPIPAAIRFTGCEDLRAAVRSILRGWTFRDVTGRRRVRPVMRLKKTPDGYRRVSKWRSTPALAREKVRRTLVGALCGFHFELIDAYAEAHPMELCLHAAAARFRDGLVVFPAVSRAGKSVLSIELARRGIPIFGDDVVPVDAATCQGIGLGILPRIRPPLPRSASPALRAFVRAHKGLGRGNRLYVAIPDEVMPRYGARAPIRAIVLLERVARSRSALVPADPADVLETLVLQHFAELVPADRILRTFYDVVMRANCFRLRYSNTAAAAAALVKAFSAPRGARARRPHGGRRKVVA